MKKRNFVLSIVMVIVIVSNLGINFLETNTYTPKNQGFSIQYVGENDNGG